MILLIQKRQSFSFMSNDAIKIADPAIDFYKDLDLIIEDCKKR